MAIETIEVRRYGEGCRTVVVLHGGPGAPGSVGSLARDLATEGTVLEPLQRRHGALRLTVARHVKDLAAVAPEGAVIVGWSWGAMLALSYAARTGRAAGVVLIGCGTYDEASRSVYRKAMEERLGLVGRESREELRRRLSTEADQDARDRLLGRIGALSERAQAFEPLPAGAENDHLPADAAGHTETWQDVLRLQAERVEPAAFAAIRVPVLMLHGEDDPHPGPATRDVLRRFIPHLEYRSFERCGHTPWRERHAREPFLAALRGWLRSTCEGPGEPA